MNLSEEYALSNLHFNNVRPLAWARKFGQGLDELTPEERHDYLQMIVEQVIIDRDNNVDITLAIPIDDDSSDPDSPEPESAEPQCVSIGSQEPSP